MRVSGLINAYARLSNAGLSDHGLEAGIGLQS
jgi:hypothetical protein